MLHIIFRGEGRGIAKLLKHVLLVVQQPFNHKMDASIRQSITTVALEVMKPKPPGFESQKNNSFENQKPKIP